MTAKRLEQSVRVIDGKSLMLGHCRRSRIRPSCSAKRQLPAAQHGIALHSTIGFNSKKMVACPRFLRFTNELLAKLKV